MEWVQTSGKTIDEAKERALDELGVDDRDAEFEVLEEPRSGLFGLTRGDAKVRARVRPTSPRPKQERGRRRSGGGGRERSRSGGGNGGGRSRSSRGGVNGGNGGGRSRGEASDRDKDRDQDRKQDDDRDRGRSGGGNGGGRGGGRSGGNDGGGRNRSSRNEGGRERYRDNDRPKEDKGEPMTEASVQEQAAAAEEFLSGLVEAFGLTADVSSEEVTRAHLDRIDAVQQCLAAVPRFGSGLGKRQRFEGTQPHPALADRVLGVVGVELLARARVGPVRVHQL